MNEAGGNGKVRLDALCEAIVDCEHKTAPIEMVGIPSVRTTDISNGRINFEACNRVSEATYKTWTQRMEPRSGDLILAREAPVGEVGIIPRGQRACLGQRTVLIRPNQKSLDGRYLLYLLLTPEMRHEWRSRSEGSTVAHLNMSDIRALAIPSLPPIAEQTAIAAILGALDDKIELNRRMNRTLEAIARTIFKSWFIDFDPVRAKIEGSDPALPKPIADLFPDSFQDSELGGIPKGWSPASLPALIEVNPSRPLRKGDVAPYLDMSNMPTTTHAPDAWIDRPSGSGMRFKNGDTLVARITPCLENGKTAFVDFLSDGEIAWGSTEYIVLSPKPPLPPVFGYCLARSDEFRTFTIQRMTGSSGRQRVPAECLQQFIMATPGPKVAQKFASVAEPLFDRAKAAISQSRVLAALRDALLPKLISGEIRIKDAERIVGRVV